MQLRHLLVAGLALVTATAGEEEHEQRECSADPESCLGEAARPAPGIPALDELTEAQRAELARVWVDNGLAEHASVASFSRFSLQLMSVAAPAALVEAAHKAAIDEINHAKLCFGLAHKFGGKPMGPGPFPIPDNTVHIATNILDMAISVATEGCIGETLSVVRAAAQIEMSHDPSVRRVLTTIANDEARHAGLAWKTVRWAYSQANDEEKASIREALTRPFAMESGRAPATEEEKHEESVMEAYGVLSPYKTRMLDEDHRDWLLPAMTKALLEGGPVKLKDDSVRLTHKKRRSSEVNLYVARFLDLAGFLS